MGRIQLHMPVEPPAQRSSPRPTLRIGSVSFLNAKPLIYGLEEAAGLELHLDVPSRLLDGLAEDRFDVALLPVIDYQRLAGLRILASGGIGSDGRTMTVRIFSPVPVERITTLACDTDSHTSVALARILLAERFNIRPEFVPLSSTQIEAGTARLLIGDKVVCGKPAGLHHQLDLGEAWKQQTGLPFVFAAWMARGGIELGDLPERLERAKRIGRAQVEAIIRRHATPLGWPAGVAREYLTERLQYDIGPDHLKAIRLFHQLAFRHGLIPHPPWDLNIIPIE
jgi:chorismate dehydratase